MTEVTDEDWMARAIAAGDRARFHASPNPWVGAVIVHGSHVFEGHTQPPGGRHAERVALDLAGRDAAGSTLYTTLEPCSHTGRTGPCSDAIIEARVARVVVGLQDPDPLVAGRGISQLREAGIEVDVGIGADQVASQLRPYLHHRSTGRPWVTLKLAATLDGRTAAPDGTSQWITGPQARADGHRLRALADGVLVGAGTIRTDNPSLTVRDFLPPAGVELAAIQPRRFVLGTAPPDCNAQPLTELQGELADVLARMASHGIVSLLVEGGAGVAAAFHHAGLVDEYVLYLAPALFGGDAATGMFRAPGATTMSDLWRGTVQDVAQLGEDIRIRIRAGSPR